MTGGHAVLDAQKPGAARPSQSLARGWSGAIFAMIPRRSLPRSLQFAVRRTRRATDEVMPNGALPAASCSQSVIPVDTIAANHC